MKLKDSFKDTDFYKFGVVYVNKRIANDRKDIHELDQSIRDKIYKKDIDQSRLKTIITVN